MSIQSVLDTVRQPEYIGENRCIPCTLVNLAIAAVVCLALSFVQRSVAIVFGILALVSIALRGYLVPGTPTLTKRYFPDRVLALFDKEPVPTFENRGLATDMNADTGTNTTTDTDYTTETDSTIDTDSTTDTDADSTIDTDADSEDSASLDTEQILFESGIVELCEDIDDLCLASDFRTDWNDRMDSIVESGAEREALVEALDHNSENETENVDEDELEIEFEEYGEAFAAHLNGRSVGQWESRAAFVADLAAARELPDWIDDWETLDATEQGTLVRGLRVFIETCPSCDGPVVPSQETVESCCREHTVVAIACEECDERLFEAVAEPDMMHS